MKIDHHLFCSISCHTEYTRRVLSDPGSRYRRYATYAMVLLLLGGFLYFALLADAFYNGGNAQNKQSEAAEISLSLPVAVNEERGAEIMIRHPLNGTRSESQMIEVSGQAPHNSRVGLYLNGTMIDTTAAGDGQYRFDRVLLTKQTNVLQTRFYAWNGSSDASPAIMVFYQVPIDSQQQQHRTSSFFQNTSVSISRGNLTRKEIALTFNGTSGSDSAIRILDALQQADVRCTFFLSSEFISNYAELTHRIAARHEVAVLAVGQASKETDHEITREEFQNGLSRTAESLESITGSPASRLWRSYSDADYHQLLPWAGDAGYVHVSWTFDPQNRQNSPDPTSNILAPPYFPAALMKDRLLSFGRDEPEQANGAIVLLQLGSERPAGDPLDRWIPEIIMTLRLRGYRFVTVTELLQNNSTASGSLQASANLR